MPKIVVTDTDFEDNAIEIEMAKEAGVDLALYNDRSADAIIRHAQDADGVVTSYGDYSARVFEALPNLKVVSRTGIGYDNIDAQAATKNGTAVCIVPGYGTEVVSDHAITLALACLRRLNECDADMRAGVWDYTRRRPFGQVYGRIFGVVGMGEIGRAVARKAAGLGFRVICYSRSLVPSRRTPEGYEIGTLEDVLKQADVVSFHTALTPETHHLLNADNMRLMKSGAVVVNTSRGAVIDTVALAAALREDRLWGAGIDVFEEEPLDWDHPIMKAPHTVLSPHVAYYSEESGEELHRRSMQAALDVVLGHTPKDCLNPEVLEVAQSKTTCAELQQKASIGRGPWQVEERAEQELEQPVGSAEREHGQLAESDGRKTEQPTGLTKEESEQSEELIEQESERMKESTERKSEQSTEYCYTCWR